MTKKRIIFCTILSLFLLAAFFPATALGSPRGQMDRQGYSSTQQQPRQETPVYNPPAPSNPAPSNPAPPPSGGSGGSGGTTTPSQRTFRSGGYQAPSVPAPAPAPSPAPPSSPPSPAPAVPSAPSWMTPAEAEAFKLLNEFRIKNGVSPLEAHQALTEVARLKAKDMSENNYFAHNSPTYGSPGNMVRQAGISARSVGENLSGAGNVRQAQVQLEHSSGHRQNMLNPNYDHVGIGIEPWRASPGIVMVQLFIRQ